MKPFFSKFRKNKYFQGMEPIVCISLKRIAISRMQAVNDGLLSRDQAENIIKSQSRYSSKTREQLIAGLTECYDPECVEAFRFFRLL